MNKELTIKREGGNKYHGFFYELSIGLPTMMVTEDYNNLMACLDTAEKIINKYQPKDEQNES